MASDERAIENWNKLCELAEQTLNLCYRKGDKEEETLARAAECFEKMLGVDNE